MSTFRLVSVSGRVATVALLAFFVSSPAFAEMCIDMNVRFDEREAPAALVESMKIEAASIWEPYGVRFRWEETTTLARCAWTHASFDVLLDHPTLRPAGSSKTILGSTRLAPDAIERVPIHIDRKATEDVLGSMHSEQYARLLGRQSLGAADVGRALGRVLAHEVGHVLLAARDHQRQGLMRPTFLAQDLLSPMRGLYSLSPAEVTRLRQRERALDVIASERTGDCTMTSMARAAGNALRSPAARSAPPTSRTDPGS